MNWLTNFVRPKIRAVLKKPDVPDNLWRKCPSCDAMIFHRNIEANDFVCEHCGHHMRLPAEKRLAMVFDGGDYTAIELGKVPVDPLKFRDTSRYTERLKQYQNKTGRKDAILVGHGRIGGHASVVACLDFSFMGGSMGMAVGEGLIAAANLAVLQHAPMIAITSSGGARMQEGALSLMQLPRTVIAVEKLREAGLPYIVVLTDPTTGGVSASFAMLGDIHIAEKGAVIGFAGARVIENTIRETLPEGFQRAEYLYEHGMIDIVVARHELKGLLVRLIGLLSPRKVEADAPDEVAAELTPSVALLAAPGNHEDEPETDPDTDEDRPAAP